jgi:hypothetical protein
MDNTLMGMGGTMEYFEKTLVVMNTTMTHVDESLEEMTPRLTAMIGRLEVIIGSVERVVEIAEAAMLPLFATQSVVRGVVNGVRGRTGLSRSPRRFPPGTHRPSRCCAAPRPVRSSSAGFRA